jgi:CRISPR-associated protein Cst2
MSQNRELSHITGTFLIEAPTTFLNGAGIEPGEYENLTAPKHFRDSGSEIPYVSAQAWRRWLRNTMMEETGWTPSELKAVHYNKKGNVDQIASELNPIDFADDDLFGYMRAKGKAKAKESTDEDEAEEEKKTETKSKAAGKVKSIMRASPFTTSLLVSIKRMKSLPVDEGYVHLKEGTPLPYSTRFYSTHLQAIFSLNYGRLGVFSNVGDRIELDEQNVESLVSANKISVVEDRGPHGKVYRMVDGSQRKKRAAALLRSLARLRGGAKQAQFAADVAPKVLLMAGLSCGNPIFNQIFRDTDESPTLNIERLREVVNDYRDRIVTPVYIGIRTGYLQNEVNVKELASASIEGVRFFVGTPIGIVEEMASELR